MLYSQPASTRTLFVKRAARAGSNAFLSAWKRARPLLWASLAMSSSGFFCCDSRDGRHADDKLEKFQPRARQPAEQCTGGRAQQGGLWWTGSFGLSSRASPSKERGRRQHLQTLSTLHASTQLLQSTPSRTLSRYLSGRTVAAVAAAARPVPKSSPSPSHTSSTHERTALHFSPHTPPAPIAARLAPPKASYPHCSTALHDIGRELIHFPAGAHHERAPPGGTNYRKAQQYVPIPSHCLVHHLGSRFGASLELLLARCPFGAIASTAAIQQLQSPTTCCTHQ